MANKKKDENRDITEMSEFKITNLSINEIETYTNLCDYTLTDLRNKISLSPGNSMFADDYNKMFNLRQSFITEIKRRMDEVYDKIYKED